MSALLADEQTTAVSTAFKNMILTWIKMPMKQFDGDKMWVGKDMTPMTRGKIALTGGDSDNTTRGRGWG